MHYLYKELAQRTPHCPHSKSPSFRKETTHLSYDEEIKTALQGDICGGNRHVALLTCLPVHRGWGLRRAGMGILPSQSSSHIRMFMNTSLGMKVSRFVMSRQPSSVSCTMPITGLLPYTHAPNRSQHALWLLPQPRHQSVQPQKSRGSTQLSPLLSSTGPEQSSDMPVIMATTRGLLLAHTLSPQTPCMRLVMRLLRDEDERGPRIHQSDWTA